MKKLLSLRPAIVVFGALVVTYAVLSFILPASSITKAMYGLSDTEYSYILFLIRIPILITWCLAFYGYRRLREYAREIAETTEGKDFSHLSTGVGWIAWGYAVPAVIRTILYALANEHPSFLSSALIITNYMYVLVSVVAFTYISSGAHHLAGSANMHLSIRQMRIAIGGLAALGILFCVFVASNLVMTSITNAYNAYYLPNWAIWSTIVLPYIFAWASGLFAAMEIMVLARRTKGIIYRRALFLLAAGIVLMIVSLSAAQYFRTIVPRTGHLTIGLSLIATYVIYCVGGVGSLLLAWGAKRLKRIEEV